jgi:hypothetical protein
MQYETAQGPPPPGSLLESVFLLMAKKRREADFFRTKLLVEATLAPHAKDSDGLSKAFDAYRESMFPFLGEESQKETIEAKKTLEQWVANKALKVRPLWRASDTRGIRSRLRRGKERVEELEEKRRQLQLVRI